MNRLHYMCCSNMCCAISHDRGIFCCFFQGQQGNSKQLEVVSVINFIIILVLSMSQLMRTWNNLNHQITLKDISEFCTTQHIEWTFIPEKVPHFRGLLESAVKYHLKIIVKLTFQEHTTVLTASMNSRPIVALPSDGEAKSTLSVLAHTMNGTSGKIIKTGDDQSVWVLTSRHKPALQVSSNQSIII